MRTFVFDGINFSVIDGYRWYLMYIVGIDLFENVYIILSDFV